MRRQISRAVNKEKAYIKGHQCIRVENSAHSAETGGVDSWLLLQGPEDQPDMKVVTRQSGNCHTHSMMSENLGHLCRIRRATASPVDHLRSIAKICRSHRSRGCDTELSHIFSAEIIKKMYRASCDAQSLAV